MLGHFSSQDYKSKNKLTLQKCHHFEDGVVKIVFADSADTNHDILTKNPNRELHTKYMEYYCKGSWCLYKFKYLPKIC